MYNLAWDPEFSWPIIRWSIVSEKYLETRKKNFFSKNRIFDPGISILLFWAIEVKILIFRGKNVDFRCFNLKIRNQLEILPTKVLANFMFA